MSTFIGSMVIVGGSVLLSLAGVILVRRWVPLPVLEAQNDVAGFIIAVLGVAYAVLLAFVIFVVWSQFEDTKAVVAREANAVNDAYRLGQGLPEPSRRQITDLTRGYARVVVGEEWETTGHGSASLDSPRAWKLLDQLWEAVRKTTPRTAAEQALYTQLLAEMHDISSERKLRLLAAREGIPSLMWVVLVIGAMVTVAFTYFFGVRSFRSAGADDHGTGRDDRPQPLLDRRPRLPVHGRRPRHPRGIPAGTRSDGPALQQPQRRSISAAAT